MHLYNRSSDLKAKDEANTKENKNQVSVIFRECYITFLPLLHLALLLSIISVELPAGTLLPSGVRSPKIGIHGVVTLIPC